MALAWKASWVKALRGSNPLSSAIRKEHPFGCSFLIYKVSGYGTEQTSKAKAMEQVGRSPDCLTVRSIAISTAIAVD